MKELMMRMKRWAAWLPVLGVTLMLGADAADPAWEKELAKYLQLSRAEHNHRIERWDEAAAWSFDDGKMPAEFKAFSGEWAVADGRLRGSGDKPGNYTLKIADCRWPAFRLEFDAALSAARGVPAERVCDLIVSLNADPQTGGFDDGYAVLCGVYYNQATVIYRLNVPHARTEWAPLVPGKTHKIAIEVVKPHIRFFVDGKIVLEAWDRGPKGSADSSPWLEMDPTRALTLRTYESVLEVDNLRILVPAEEKTR